MRGERVSRAVVRVGLAAALGAGLVACAAAGEDPEGVGDLAGREWVLEELAGEPIDGDAEVTLLIDDGQVSGSSGCNRYIGAVDLAQGSLAFESEIAATMMACPDELMALERAYLTALATVADWAVADDRLTLLDADGAAVAVFA